MKGKSSHHRTENTFRFKSFADRLADINIDVVHRIARPGSDLDPDATITHFFEALQKWSDLNCTETFVSFSKDVAKSSETLPQLLHHEVCFGFVCACAPVGCMRMRVCALLYGYAYVCLGTALACMEINFVMRDIYLMCISPPDFRGGFSRGSLESRQRVVSGTSSWFDDSIGSRFGPRILSSVSARLSSLPQDSQQIPATDADFRMDLHFTLVSLQIPLEIYHQGFGGDIRVSGILTLPCSEMNLLFHDIMIMIYQDQLDHDISYSTVSWHNYHVKSQQIDVYVYIHQVSLHLKKWLTGLYKYIGMNNEETFRTFTMKLFDFIRSLLSPLLDAHCQRRYIVSFAAESYAYLLRKTRDFSSLVDFLVDKTRTRQGLVGGLGKVLFEMLKGLKGKLHSTATAIWPLVRWLPEFHAMLDDY